MNGKHHYLIVVKIIPVSKYLFQEDVLSLTSKKEKIIVKKITISG